MRRGRRRRRAGAEPSSALDKVGLRLADPDLDVSKDTVTLSGGHPDASKPVRPASKGRPDLPKGASGLSEAARNAAKTPQNASKVLSSGRSIFFEVSLEFWGLGIYFLVAFIAFRGRVLEFIQCPFEF